MDPFVAEIRVFPFNFPPKGWAHCSGQLMPISQNTALFSLLGTYYGGDGKSTFGLPNFEGSAAIGVSDGFNGTSLADIGSVAGSPSVTLLQSEIPSHVHQLRASADDADLQAPAADRALATSTGGNAYQTETNANLVTMSPQTLAPTGATYPHNNFSPVLTLNFCIALQGVYPQRP
jgi:microcystin-dependent protein